MAFDEHKHNGGEQAYELQTEKISKMLPTVIEQFERQARTTPDSTAIVFEETSLTYQELDKLANRFAHAMRNAGIVKGSTVGLCIERRPEAIASMLGAFKIGAVYVPLDPEYPAERVRYMIDDAAVRVVVTHDLRSNKLASALFDLANQQDSEGQQLLWIDSASKEFAQTPSSVIHDLSSENDLAYIMYTSGSTGMPKGVQIEHRALSVYCDADRQVYDLTANDRTLQFSTLNFDIAIEEIFPPLLTGGVVVIRPSLRSASNNELSSIIERYQITAIHIATAYWHEWVDLMVAAKTPVPSSLRLVIATGEKVSVEHYRRWKSLCRQPIKWCNAYGPTETTVTATVFIPDQDFSQEHMPIGKPLVGYEAFILDENDRLLGVGETGALYLGGAALARGYHNNPEKTNAAFRIIDLPVGGPTRLYRTGDLARWLPSGDIEFAGRVDHQIKVGSYRIEPGEIEVAVAKFPGVLESIVVHEEIAGQKFLIAYVAVGTNSIQLKQLKEYLQSVLPVYMVPPRYVLLEGLPKTINGKIDRAKLPPASSSQAIIDAQYATPDTLTQKKLAEIWQRVLNVPSIGIHDDFFALGGSSLLVTRVVTALTSDLGIELPVRDFFANPTLIASAEHIDRLIARKTGATVSTTAAKASTEELRARLPLVFPEMLPISSGRLFTVRYQPRTASRQHAILICNSIGHEHSRAYRNLQQLSLLLAESGFDVLRFDYRGTGNSSGSCGECTQDSLVEDTRAVATFLRQQANTRRLSIIGIRLGATVASLSQIDDVNQMIWWDPVIRGQNFVELLDRFHKLTLRNQTRFVKVVKHRGRKQAYGHQLGPEKRLSISSMQTPLRLEGICEQGLVLASAGYPVDDLRSTSLGPNWHLMSLDDHIDWNQPDYAERAFSSPAANKAVLEFLKEHHNGTVHRRYEKSSQVASDVLEIGELAS